jgi:hypothetical protein
VRSKAREVNLSEILIILNSLATSNNWKKKLDVLASVYSQGVEAQSTMCINVHELNSRTTGNVSLRELILSLAQTNNNRSITELMTL